MRCADQQLSRAERDAHDKFKRKGLQSFAAKPPFVSMWLSESL
jgi:hypothetical protein